MARVNHGCMHKWMDDKQAEQQYRNHKNLEDVKKSKIQEKLKKVFKKNK